MSDSIKPSSSIGRSPDHIARTSKKDESSSTSAESGASTTSTPTSSTAPPSTSTSGASEAEAPAVSPSSEAFGSPDAQLRRSREQSREVTSEQASVSEDLVGAPTGGSEPASGAFWEEHLPEEDRQAAEESRAAKAEASRQEFVSRLPEEDRQAIQEGRETRERETTQAAERSRQEFIGRLPEEDQQAIEESRALAAEESRLEFISNLPEEDQQAIQQGLEIREVTEVITAAETPQEQVQILTAQIEEGDIEAAALLQQAGPEIFQSLEGAEQAEVSETLVELSTLVQEDPDAAALVATQFVDNAPQNFSGVVEGFAIASVEGQSALGRAVAQEVGSINGDDPGLSNDPEASSDPTAEAIARAAALGDSVSEIQDTVVEGDLASSHQATQKITEIIDGAPPEIAQVLVAQLDQNGALGTITQNLEEVATDHDGSVSLADRAAVFTLLDPVPEGESIAPQQQFDRVVAQLSNLSTAAGDDGVTELLGERIAGVIGDDIGRFDEAFELTISGGVGAGLAGEVAQQVHTGGQENSAANIVEGVERGAEAFLNTFDEVADTVDIANSDLGFLLANWADFYPDTEAGQEALAAQVQQFQDGRPEYQNLDRLSANVGQDLEVLRDLQGLFPEKQHLKNRELDLLGEVTRFGATPNGLRAIGEAVERQGQGETSFLDRLMDTDFKNSLSEDELGELGFDNFGQFQDTVGQQVTTATIGSMGEAAQLGDRERFKSLSEGLVQNAALLDTPPATLREIGDAYSQIMDADYGLLDNGAGGLAEGLSKLERIKVNNPLLQTRFRAGGAALGLIATGLAWHQAFSDGELSADELARTTTKTGDLVAAGLEALATYRGGGDASYQLFGRFTPDGLAKAGKVFAGLTGILDTASALRALNDEDYIGAGINGLSALGGFVAAAGATGVGAALGIGAAALGAAYAQYNKVKASNRFESEEAEKFIAGALRANGFEGNLDPITHHLRNADDEGRHTGVLIQQAAIRGGIPPAELLSIIAQQDPDNILRIVTTGHGIDPQEGSLTSLIPADPTLDGRIGERVGPRAPRVHGPRTVEGFLIWLDRQGYINRGFQGQITNHNVL